MAEDERELPSTGGAEPSPPPACRVSWVRGHVSSTSLGTPPQVRAQSLQRKRRTRQGELWKSSESDTEPHSLLPPPTSQSREGGWCGVAQGLGIPWAVHSHDSSLSSPSPRGTFVRVEETLTSCRKHPTGALGAEPECRAWI